eukprot:gene3656-4084_t
MYAERGAAAADLSPLPPPFVAGCLKRLTDDQIAAVVAHERATLAPFCADADRWHQAIVQKMEQAITAAALVTAADHRISTVVADNVVAVISSVVEFLSPPPPVAVAQSGGRGWAGNFIEMPEEWITPSRSNCWTGSPAQLSCTGLE